MHKGSISNICINNITIFTHLKKSIWYDQYRLIFIRNLWFFFIFYFVFVLKNPTLGSHGWWERRPTPTTYNVTSKQKQNNGSMMEKENGTAFYSHPMDFVVCISLSLSLSRARALIWTRRLVFLSFSLLSLVSVVYATFFLLGFQTVERKVEWWMWKRGKINKDCTATVC